MPDDPLDRLPQWQLDDDAAGPPVRRPRRIQRRERSRIERAPRGSGGNAAGILLGLLALAWLGVSGWVIAQGAPPVDIAAVLNLVAMVSMPLVLLGVAWLVFGYSPSRRTDRFRAAVEQMRGESQALERVLESVAARLDENQRRLTDEAARLMSLGDEASDRIGRVAQSLAQEGKTLDRQAEALETAAANAKVDIGVLLLDLPRAEEQARGMAAAMREAGLAAHQQAGALDGQLGALSARGREADDVVGGAAQRLAAHLARIESTTVAATERLDEATLGMTAAIDGAMSRAAEAIDQTRSSLDAQGSAMLATVEQSRAALNQAGDEAARSLAQRIDRIGIKIEGLAGQIASQDEASRALVARLTGELEDLDRRFTVLREAGVGGAEQLHRSFADMRPMAEGLIGDLGSGHERAGVLLGRLEELSRGLGGVTERLQDELPEALVRVEQQAERARVAAAGVAPQVDAIEASAGSALAKLDQAEASVGRQREAIEAMAARLAEELAALDERIALLRDAGATSADRLRESFAGVGGQAQDLMDDLARGQERTGALGERIAELARALGAMTEEFEEPVTGALGRVEEQTARAHEAIGQIVPMVSAIDGSAEGAATRLQQVEASVVRQRDAVEAMLGQLNEGAVSAEQQLRGLATAASEAEEAAARLTREAGPELIEALLRVRETAAQAAGHAREAIGAVIPESAAALADASRKAVTDAVTGPVEEQMAELVKVAGAAVEAARHASERLTRQLLGIGEAAAQVEDRIEESRRDHEERESESLSRHVSLLTESLNSAAIDVTKILSNEVTDAAWTAYLKGDRGVFTRRAVRLLNSTESREVLRHYEEDQDFREHVNRYIHDFEAMMRRVLADRDGSPLGVTILSSDMGKLYVALAQAIERLRR